MTAALLPTYPNPNIVCDGLETDACSIEKSAVLSGVSNSKTGIFSVWVDPTDLLGADILLRGTTVSPAANNILIQRAPGGAGFETVFVLLYNSAGTQIATIESVTELGLVGGYVHLLVSWDLSVPTAHFYFDDVEDYDSGASSLTDDTVEYEAADFWTLNTTAASYKDFNIAELYFAPGQYLDFSVVSNRRKFISANGKPVHLGSDGSLPTGTAPVVYFHLDDSESAANFATNAGSGGNFSVNGTAATASSSPN